MARPSTGGLWLKGLLPLALLAVLLVVFFRVGPLGVFRGAFPPLEELTIDRVSFPAPGQVRIQVTNGGPEPVTIAQVMMDEAYWSYSMRPEGTVGRLRSATVDVPYPWVEGEPVAVTLVTSTGITFLAEVDVATQSPRADRRYLGTFAVLGIYVGVIPVFLGLLWLPFLTGLSKRWVGFFLSLTLGLLVFLGIDAIEAAIELLERVPSAFQGVGLLTLGVVGTPMLLQGVVGGGGEGTSPFRVALLIALGIGLHNLGEGLAIGSAYAVGEVALGTSLVLGFLLHNTTEGLGIVAPLAAGEERTGLGALVVLGALAGVPTIAGAWIGGLSYSPTWSVLFLAIGAGAVVQVVWVLGRMLRGRDGASMMTGLNAAGLVAGLLIMWVTGLFVAA